MLTSEKIDKVLSHLPSLKIGLVGDLFLDRYLELVPGHHELSIETGLEAYQIFRVRNSPGALGTVMNNLSALGVGRLIPLTVLGDDGHGYDLLQALKKLPVDSSAIVSDPQRLTPTYTKPMQQDTSGTWQELNRLDVRSREPLNAACTAKLIDQMRRVFSESDGMIVLDQINETNCGVVNSEVRAALKQLVAVHRDKLVFTDSRAHLAEFDFGVVKGNRSEVFGATGVTNDSDAALELAMTRLAERTQQPVICTAGERGIYVARTNHPVQCVPGFPVSGPIDIVGAGDAATSGMVTGLLSGLSIEEAAGLGNLVASITVQQLGTTGTASPSQVRTRWAEVGARK